MSRRSFLGTATREAAAAAIRQIESSTAVEVVVTVHQAADRHRRTGFVVGGGAALLTLLVMLLSPTLYHIAVIAVDTVLAFALGVLVCFWLPGVRRVLTPKSIRERAVERDARAAFDELGVGNTRGNTGLLVYVALFERRVLALPDRGICAELLGERYQQALDTMQRAVERLDEHAFLDGLSQLELPLAQLLPRQPDDVNELSDEVV